MSRTEVLRRALECVYSGATEREAEALADALGLEQVCFVPHLFGPSGELAVPLNGTCDIEWHRHFYRLREDS